MIIFLRNHQNDKYRTYLKIYFADLKKRGVSSYSFVKTSLSGSIKDKGTEDLVIGESLNDTKKIVIQKSTK